ncbi:MAG TPA: alpha/beta hydrolase, partial [Ideonella sp.]|nr:alpha/beta hydrolase [Ideonella sp.]
STDGVTLYWMWVPGVPRDYTLIYCHGQATDITSAWPRIEDLAPLGYNLVVWDYRGFGRSTGTPSEAGIVADEDALWGAVVRHANVDPARLIYYGRSFGGAPCIDLATRHPPAVLIEESTFTSVDALVADATPVDLPHDFVAHDHWDSLSNVATLGAVPFLALHGAADDYVQPKYAVELTGAHPGPARTELVLVPGADHSNVPDTMGLDAYRATVDKFVRGF